MICRHNASRLSQFTSFSGLRIFFVVFWGLIISPSALLAQDRSPGLESEQQSVDSLIEEAQALFRTGQSIDARAKLQKAVQLAPDDYRAFMWLGEYYLVEVGHFQLAYRHLKTAESNFQQKFGTNIDQYLISGEHWREHAALLRLLGEAHLNLDDYQGALDVLDVFGAHYWGDWYPGTRAWVLMKLRRIDEAIKVAQAGLIRGSELHRTYNILGILLSISGNRKLSLEAFAQSVRAELASGGINISTPLNNAGEVYNEMFNEPQAEASWVKSLQMPDGCEHILPSLNLAKLYVEQLRLHQAERTVRDFEGCYATNTQREDTEHRALLGLIRSQIAYVAGDLDSAERYVSHALDRRQWFGKIGTTEEDLLLAAHLMMSRIAKTRETTVAESIQDIRSGFAALKEKINYFLLSKWHMRKAREIAFEDLNDFEDLFIRHTDTMTIYPLLGDILQSVSTPSIKRRIARIKKSDPRDIADRYYNLFLAQNYRDSGSESSSLELLNSVESHLRPVDRLLGAVSIKEKILALKGRGFSLFRSAEEEAEILQESLRLFKLAPSLLRYNDIDLPVTLKKLVHKSEVADLVSELESRLFGSVFEKIDADSNKIPYSVVISTSGLSEEDGFVISLQLLEKGADIPVVILTEQIEPTEEAIDTLSQTFINEVFSHRSDPPSEPLPEVEFLEGII